MLLNKIPLSIWTGAGTRLTSRLGPPQCPATRYDAPGSRRGPSRKSYDDEEEDEDEDRGYQGKSKRGRGAQQESYEEMGLGTSEDFSPAPAPTPAAAPAPLSASTRGPSPPGSFLDNSRSASGGGEGGGSSRREGSSYEGPAEPRAQGDRPQRREGEVRPRGSGMSNGRGGDGYGGDRGRSQEEGAAGGGGDRRYGAEGDRGLGGGDRRYGSDGGRMGKPQWRSPMDRDPKAEQEMQQMEATNAAIREAVGWRDLARVVDERGGVMGAENASQVLFKLSYRISTRREGQTSIDEKMLSFQRPDPSLDPEGVVDYDRLLSTLLGWLLVLMPKMRTRQVSAVLNSLAKLELWNLEVVTALVETATRQMHAFDPMDYPSLITSFAKFNYSPGPDFLAMFATQSARRLKVLTISDLGKVSVGLTKIGFVPTLEWIEAFWNATGDKAHEFAGPPPRPQPGNNTFRSQGQQGQQGQQGRGGFFDQTFDRARVGNDVFAATTYFTQQGFQPPSKWVDFVFGLYLETEQARQGRYGMMQKLYQDEVAKAQKEGRGIESVPKPDMSPRLPPKISTMVQILYTLSNLTVKPSPPWFSAIFDAWRLQIKYCSTSDLGSLSLYLGRYLQAQASPEFCGFLLRYCLSPEVSSLIGGDDLASVTFLLATSQFKGKEREIDDLVYTMKKKLDSCSPAGLEMVYNALPLIGSGYRLNETVAEAGSKWAEASATP